MEFKDLDYSVFQGSMTVIVKLEGTYEEIDRWEDHIPAKTWEEEQELSKQFKQFQDDWNDLKIDSIWPGNGSFEICLILTKEHYEQLKEFGYFK